jgi:hypothetical protein
MGGANPVRAECSSLNQSSRDLRQQFGTSKMQSCDAAFASEPARLH